MNLLTDDFVDTEWARYRERQRLRELEKQEKTHVLHHKNTSKQELLQEPLGMVPSLDSTLKEGEEKQDMYQHKSPPPLSRTAFYSPIQKQLQFSPSHANAKLYTPPYNDEDSEDDDIEEYGRRVKTSTPSSNHINHNIFANTGHHNFIPRHLSPAIIKSIKQSRKQHESFTSVGGNDFVEYNSQADDSSDDDSLSEKVHVYLQNRRQEFGERKRKEKNSVKKRKKSLDFLVSQHLKNENSVKKRENSTFGERYRKDNKSVGRWTYEEKLAFLNGMKEFGIGKWSNIASTIPTRNTMQCKTHGQSMMKRCGAKDDIIKYLEKNLEEFRCRKSQPKKEISSRHTAKVAEEASMEVQQKESLVPKGLKDYEQCRKSLPKKKHSSRRTTKVVEEGSVEVTKSSTSTIQKNLKDDIDEQVVEEGFVEGQWTYEEKLAFFNGVKQYGIGKWSKIASTIPTRNTKQVKTHGHGMFKQCGEKDDFIQYLEKNLEKFRCRKSLPKNKDGSRRATKVVEEASLNTKSSVSSPSKDLKEVPSFQKNIATLKEFGGKYGHCNIPMSSFQKNIAVLKEASLKEQPTKISTSSPSKDLNDNGNQTRKEEMSSFQKNIATLKEFREKHGHCNIPKNHPDQTLYCWTQRMGMSYRFIQEGKKPPYNLQPDEIKQLTDLDFDFRKSKKKSWDTWFEQLKEYKQRHGHVNVRNTKEDNPLYMWCYRMNYAYNERKRNIKPRHSSLSEEREQKLLDIGFKFYTVKAKYFWKSFNEWFAELESFKASHGHIEVPCSHEHRYLHQWCLAMKKLCEESKQGSYKFDKEEIKKLEEIGFCVAETTKGSDDEKELASLDGDIETAKDFDDKMKPVPLIEDTSADDSDDKKELASIHADIETAKGSD